jgi:DnaJ family protein A protein 3
VSIGIPAGVEDGQTMRVQIGKQEVFITFKVRFARSKYTHISSYRSHQVHISDGTGQIFTATRLLVCHKRCLVVQLMSQASMKTLLQFKWVILSGALTIFFQIPAGTASHVRILLKGKGIKKANSYGYGDHYIHVRITVPKCV